MFARRKEKKLWNQKEYKQCRYCFFSAPGSHPEQVNCRFRGEKDALDKCHRFRYDATKRKPRTAPVLPKYSAEDFEI